MNELVVVARASSAGLVSALGAQNASSIVDAIRAGIGRAATPRKAGVWAHLGEPRGTDAAATLRGAFERSFARGSRATIVIFDDCPSIDRDVVEDAFSELARRDVVLRASASSGGGVSLVGIAKLHAGLFDGVPWDSPTTLRLVVAKAESLGLRTRMLGTDVAIRTADDLRDAWPKVQTLIPAALAAAVKPKLPAEPPPPYVPEDDGDTGRG